MAALPVALLARAASHLIPHIWQFVQVVCSFDLNVFVMIELPL